LLIALLPLLANVAAASPPQSVPEAQLATCIDQARSDLATAVVTADDWLENLKGPERAYPLQCFGIIYTRQMRWEEAEQSFLQARDATLPTELRGRAKLGAMAGNAAMADEREEDALVALDQAAADARAGDDKQAAGDIEIDRARALVALGRPAEAEKALASARLESPQNSDAWLLSATLARRLDKLAQAQSFIETAAALRPVDLEIGLEAGLIAALAGRNDAARKSWQSVIDAAPDSEIAQTARTYIDQLDKP
jgi:tetratricopeptide (TPR) repeat protein